MIDPPRVLILRVVSWPQQQDVIKRQYVVYRSLYHYTGITMRIIGTFQPSGHVPLDRKG